MDQPQQIGNFRLDERIGRGGMGEVWRAWDDELRRFVAVKLVHGENTADIERRMARLRREALTAARLSHPAILQVHGFLNQGDQLGIVMELVEGRTLSEILHGGALALPRFLSWIREVTEGLAYAHQRGVVHRDLKPNNIMIFEAGGTEHAKILDFGLARDLEQTRSASVDGGRLQGTLAYMSPEQARGDSSIDHRSDLFSLGVLIYRALTGEPPFRGESAGEILGQVMMHRPPPLRTLRPDLPESLGRIVDKLIEKDPADRYQSARDVLGELERLTTDPDSLDDRATHADPKPPIDSDSVGLMDDLDAATVGSDPSLEPKPARPKPLKRSGLKRTGLKRNVRRVVYAGVLILMLLAGYVWVLETAKQRLEEARAEGNPAERLATAQQAERWARWIRAKDLTADALLSQGSALLYLGELEEAQKRLNVAESLYIASGNDEGITDCRELLVQRLYFLGDVDGARRLASRYLEEVPETYQEGAARLNNTLGLILTDFGETEEAQQYFQRAADTYSNLGLQQHLAAVYNSQGIAFQSAGALGAAQEKYQAAREIFSAHDNGEYEAYMLTNIGECWFYLGRLKRAEEQHQNALEINRTLKLEAGQAYDLYRLGEVARVSGDFDVVEEKYYLPAARLAPDDSSFNAKIERSRAQVAFALGDFDTAESKARRAEQVLRHDDQAAEAALARTVLARALIAQHKVDQAVTVIDDIEPTLDPRTRFALAILKADLWRHGITEESPLRELEDARAEADQKGFLGASFELRSALAELHAEAGADIEGELRVLEEEAREAGFHAIAREIASR